MGRYTFSSCPNPILRDLEFHPMFKVGIGLKMESKKSERPSANDGLSLFLLVHPARLELATF
jgi:hypothetical protein